MVDKHLKSQEFWRRQSAAFVLSGVLVSAVAVADCAAGDVTSAGQGSAQTVEDPLEDINRVTSEFNRVVRGAVIDPVIDGYQYVTPQPVQSAVSNIFSNLSEPVTAVSSLLQGDTDNAANATNRFIVNTTIGVGGINDPATGMGMEQRREDLGQAMATNGVAPGPHLVLPILGPSNFRDATGDILTGLASPLPLAVHAADGGVTYSRHQDDINAIGKGSVDPYVAEREAYEQHRDYVVNNGVTQDADFPALVDEQGTDLANAAR